MRRSTKTLVVLTPGFPENEADTIWLPFLQTHLLALNKMSPETEIVILTFQYPRMKGTYMWNGNQVIAFGGEEKGKINRLLIWLKVWKILEQINREKNIIALFSLWCTECALVGKYFGKFHKLKHFTWLCGQDAKRSNKYVKYIRPAPASLIAMSDFLKRTFFENHGICPMHVIPIGVNPEQFSTANEMRDIDILGAGSLIPLKQYDVFIDVLHLLQQEIPNIKAVICGRGPEYEHLNDMIMTLQMKNLISLAGEVQHSKVLEYMKRAKIFLHTSNYEGFGTVCLEALYAGAHVVSFTKPMDQDIAHWQHVKSKEEMIVKLRALLEDKNISQEAILPFSATDIAQTLLQLFNS